MTTDFSGAVREALAAIPHGADCAGRDTGFYRPHRQECDCDREERIAQRVAAAIEAAKTEARRSFNLGGSRWHAVVDEAALRALGGLS